MHFRELLKQRVRQLWCRKAEPSVIVSCQLHPVRLCSTLRPDQRQEINLEHDQRVSSTVCIPCHVAMILRAVKNIFHAPAFIDVQELDFCTAFQCNCWPIATHGVYREGMAKVLAIQLERHAAVIQTRAHCVANSKLAPVASPESPMSLIAAPS